MFFRRDESKKYDPSEKIFPLIGRNSSQPVAIQKPFDVYLFFTTMLLCMLGIVMIYSSSAILAKERYGDDNYFLIREFIYLGIGMTGLMFTRAIPYHMYQRFVYPLLGLTALLMILTFVPGLAHSAKGARRWISVAGFTLQPSEMAKIIVVIAVAYLIAKKKETISEFRRGFLPIVIISGFFILLTVAQKDLGSAFVLASVVFIMLIVSGTKLRYILGSLLIALPGLYFAIFAVAFRRQRILAFLDPWKYQLDSGFQIIQSFVAFKSGGMTGVGLGESKQKLFYLPEAHTDFIFSVLGEEFGLIGVIVVSSLFLFLVARGLSIAKKTKDSFGMFLALGLTCLIGLEAFINFGVVMGILPTKGLALPFISYGGTSLIFSLAAIGIILNVSSHTVEEI